MNTAKMALILAIAALIGVAVVSNSLTTSVTKIAASIRALHTVTITHYKRKSTYGKPLYEVAIHNYEEQPT